jgi:hypothetical protein
MGIIEPNDKKKGPMKENLIEEHTKEFSNEDLKNESAARKGWEKAFKKMHENGDDQLLMADVFEDEKFDKY